MLNLQQLSLQLTITHVAPHNRDKSTWYAWHPLRTPDAFSFQKNVDKLFLDQNKPY
jgi:hypothetical protein